MSETLIDALRQKSCYSHEVNQIEVIESDLAWIILTGNFAYKIKKPIDLYFLDASSLEARHSLCQSEFSLNQRSYQEMYLGVVGIYQSEMGMTVGEGSGEPIEYAVKMCQFDPNQTLDQIHDRKQLNHDRLEKLCQSVFDFHSSAPISGIEMPFGEPNSLYVPAQLNFDQVRPHLTEAKDLAQLLQLEAWAHEYLRRLWPRFAERKDLGMIRECHGDLHLGNVMETESSEMRLFDCIEYRAEFRWIDVISEIAFLTIDLEARDDFASAWHLLNRYLELTGDYHALWVYQGYQAYRAMVRAKECLLGLNAPILPTETDTSPLTRYRRYAVMAEHATTIRPRVLLITLGLDIDIRQSLTHQLIDDFGMIRLRSDLERQRLYGDQEDTAPKTYRHLVELAELSLRAGFPVVVSGCFEHPDDRERFRRLAESHGLLFGILTDEDSAIEAQLDEEELASTHVLRLDDSERMIREVRDLGQSFGMHLGVQR
ncbi:AAA family ATPase [Litorivicinus sp.]|nr:AAA family ATPase [Litorivicinus sp.]